MRTTIDLDDVVLNAARTMATSRSTSLGKVISELALAGLRSNRGDAALAVKARSFPQFAVSPTADPLTDEDVRRALDDEI
jgi:hypothetical protein